ncbi:hypothetical protein [Paraburkholderia sp. CI3]
MALALPGVTLNASRVLEIGTLKTEPATITETSVYVPVVCVVVLAELS